MSFNDVYEFIQGEYQQVTRIRQEPVSTADPTFFKDLNLVKWAGYANEIWSAETGGTQLAQGLDYELQYLDVAASGPASEPVYAGYSILTPLYYNIPLFQTANIVGAYTQRPYRPSYNVITTDATVTPVSMDDSVIADASAGNISITLEDGFQLNQRYSIICKGTGTVTVGGTGIGAGAAFQGVGVSWLWDGGAWMPLAAPGERDGGIYYDWELVYTNEGAPSTTIPNVSSYGEGLSYAGVEFTYGGESVRASGTFAYYNDGIDRYTILANDVSGSDSTMNLRYDAGTDTLEAVETGSDFTNINLFGLYHWTEYTYGGYGAWANTAEAPPYGEAITSEQELYLDGTKEFVSSSGNAPVVDVVDYLPANGNVDGTDYPETASKWPGQRGTFGFFGEYENLSPDNDFVALALATLSIEGDWNKVTATSTVTTNGTASVQSTYGALATNGYFSILVRRGNTTDSQVVFNNASLYINWVAQSFTSDGGLVDLGITFISDEILLVKAGENATGSTTCKVFAENYASTTDGNFTYFKDAMVVDLPYAVPYTAGTHQPAKLQYNFNWAESAEWTYELWFKPKTETPAAFQYVWELGETNNTDGLNFVWNYIQWEVNGYDSGGTSFLSITGITVDAWNHVKFVWTTGSTVDVYVNGGTAQTLSSNVPGNQEIKLTTLGAFNGGGFNLNGYAQDFTIQPTIDTTDAHYLSGLPYYNPNKTMGKNASWSIDSRGNISGQNQVSGSIIFDGEINGQWVTRWATGLMTISAEDTSGAPNNVLVAFSVPFIVPPEDIQVTVRGANARIGTYLNPKVDEIEFKRFDTTPTGTTDNFSWTATGRWK